MSFHDKSRLYQCVTMINILINSLNGLINSSFLIGLPVQTTSRRFADRKTERFQKNITKRGSVPPTAKKANDYPVGPIVLGFFIFVVVGSSLFQIIRTALHGGMA
ncbi:stress-associated endoplasmic reticulum protein 2-like [Canna indica]|uniref:Stress-associated endoplasmic reticulum protein 2-like n=1 Tax=Canna indica TaxID=4628 RepID=A0AAQ3L0Q5_9LILI|nr:stress-associated endoplasmic reticulum protein 2-like [Canna indica]